MWMACSAIGRSTIGRWKLMMIGLPTPTMEPLVGLKDGGRNTGSPVYGVGFWPAGVPSGMVVGRAANGSAGAAGAAAGARGSTGGANGSTGPAGGAASGSAGGATSAGPLAGAGGGTIAAAGSIGASGIGASAAGPGCGPNGSGAGSGSANAKGLPNTIPAVKPAAIVAVTTFRILRCGMRTPPVKAATSLAQREDRLTP